MGLTNFWKSDTDKRAEEVRSGAVAPSRTERKKCWESRDLYFSCLDRNGILDAIKDEKAAAKSCAGEGVAFEKDCATEWVSFEATAATATATATATAAATMQHIHKCIHY
jgi:cytochrome c oxidase assembly factor 6